MGTVGRTEVETNSTVLFDMDADVAALDAHRGMTRALWRGMIQELLAGRAFLVWLSKITQ